MKAETIKRELRRLRKLVEESEDVAVSRIAYAMGNAMRWATEDGLVGWTPPHKDASKEAAFLRSELAKEEPTP
jgi:hypothetical protein